MGEFREFAPRTLRIVGITSPTLLESSDDELKHEAMQLEQADLQEALMRSTRTKKKVYRFLWVSVGFWGCPCFLLLLCRGVDFFEHHCLYSFLLSLAANPFDDKSGE